MIRRIVFGDIHGCYLTLKALMEKKVVPTPEDLIYFVGDLIDRGPRTREVLEFLIQLRCKGYHIFPIKGNHEDMLVNALVNESFLPAWYANGAEDTLQSFEIPQKQIDDFNGLKLIPDSYINFIKELPYYYDLGDYLIVHAGLNFNSDDIFMDVNAMLWSRRMDYQADKIQNKIIIHGHTPVPLISIKPLLNRREIKTLNIDAGCVYKDFPGYGNLAALDLDNRQLFFQANVD